MDFSDGSHDTAQTKNSSQFVTSKNLHWVLLSRNKSNPVFYACFNIGTALALAKDNRSTELTLTTAAGSSRGNL